MATPTQRRLSPSSGRKSTRNEAQSPFRPGPRGPSLKVQLDRALPVTKEPSTLILHPQPGGLFRSLLFHVIRATRLYHKILLRDFHIDSILGRGAFGSVYRAIPCQYSRATSQMPGVVVLKAIPCSFTNIMGYRAFRDEMKIQTKFSNHPNIVPAYTSFHERGCNFLVLRYQPGGTVDRLLDIGPLPERAALRIGAQAARALAHMHENGYAHRDVKPENIMLECPLDMVKDVDSFHARLGDFGLSCCTDGPRTDRCGTRTFMAPEIMLEDRYRADCADIYSLGVMVFELLSTDFPFIRDGNDIFFEKRFMGVYMTGALWNKVSEETKVLIRRCMDSVPENRPKAKDVAVLMDQFADAAPRVSMDAWRNGLLFRRKAVPRGSSS